MDDPGILAGVPLPDKDLKPGTLSGTLRQARVNSEDFI